MNVMYPDMGEHQAGASGGSDHDRILRRRKRGQNVAERHGLRTSRAQGVLLDQLLVDPDILPAPALFPPSGVGHQILVFRRHDVEELRANLDPLFTHGLLLSLLSSSHRHFRVSWSCQLPRPARVATDLPSDRWICST